METVEKMKSKYSLEDSISAINTAIETSQFLKDVSLVREKFQFSDQEGKYRNLIGAEIFQMEQQGVKAEDWEKVLVTPDFDSSRVQRCTLQGNIRLGNFSGSVRLKRRTIRLPSGVYNCDLKNVIVEDGALVSRTSLLNNVYIGPKACVMGCGEVICSGNTTFGNGTELPLAIETGGRDTLIFAEMTVSVAAGVATNRADSEGLARYAAALKKYKEKATSPCTIIGCGSRVMHTPRVTNVYMGAGAHIDSAVWVEEATLLSTEKECAMVLAGCSVKNAIMQWGSTIDSVSMISNALLCEHSTIMHHGKVSDSIIGPNSYVSEAECTATLCGPFVTLDHQALLIACLWPEGKGSVSYGANVGSNHTSKAPDQELWSGEGTFYGLGCCIKYPTDFSQAPYSIIGSGVITLPQKMCFPFSLIASPSDNITDLSPAFNELIPAWLLGHSIESLRIKEKRMMSTNKATRQVFPFEILHPETIDQMIKARNILRAAENTAHLITEDGEKVYTSKQIQGLGKNYLRECNRITAIELYTFYIQYYCLTGLYKQLKSGANPKTVLTEEKDNHFWSHQRSILLSEVPDTGLIQLLRVFVSLEETIQLDIKATREADDVLGRAVIGDYDDAHKTADEDPILVEAQCTVSEVKADIAGFIKLLKE